MTGVLLPTLAARSAERRRRLLATIVAHVRSLPQPVRRLVVVDGMGNAGDAVIAWATRRVVSAVARMLALPLVAVTAEDCQPRADDVVILPGGGTLLPCYDCMWVPWRACLATPPAGVVVLPHSLRPQPADLVGCDRSWLIVPREGDSEAHLRALHCAARIHPGHDLVCCAGGAPRPRALPVIVLAVIAHGLWPRRCRHLLGQGWRSLRYLGRRRNRLLLARREDIEGRRDGPPWPTGSTVDLSAFHSGVYRPGVHADVVAWMFVSVVAAHRPVCSDRLHVSLVAVLLGLPTLLYDNCHGKLSAVYRRSLLGLRCWMVGP